MAEPTEHDWARWRHATASLEPPLGLVTRLAHAHRKPRSRPNAVRFAAISVMMIAAVVAVVLVRAERQQWRAVLLEAYASEVSP